jgi:hypothetical protein
MSIFPRHVVPGQATTIHLRVAVTSPCFPLARVSIRAPDGGVVFQDSRLLLGCLPAPATECAPPGSQQCSEGMSESPPLLLLAQHLSADTGDCAELIAFLRGMAHSLHTYWHFRVPDDAALGCYPVELGVSVDGQLSSSATASNDRIFVERLELEDCAPASGGVSARIRNGSPHPVRARLHELSRGPAGLRANIQAIELPALATTTLRAGGERAFLSYAEGGGQLWLTAGGAGVVIRDPSCAWLRSKDERVVVTHRVSRRSFTLSGRPRDIWLRADGIAQRAELEALDATAFGALLGAGLLRAL